MAEQTTEDIHRFLTRLAQGIYDKNGKNILALDVRDLSLMMDYVIICEGNVDRHTRAIAKHLIDIAQEVGVTPYKVDGMADGLWVVIDFSEVIVHIFIPDMREKYELEKLWNESKIVDLNIAVHERDTEEYL